MPKNKLHHVGTDISDLGEKYLGNTQALAPGLTMAKPMKRLQQVRGEQTDNYQHHDQFYANQQNADAHTASMLIFKLKMFFSIPQKQSCSWLKVFI
jgi:hypothetical protein